MTVYLTSHHDFSPPIQPWLPCILTAPWGALNLRVLFSVLKWEHLCFPGCVCCHFVCAYVCPVFLLCRKIFYVWNHWDLNSYLKSSLKWIILARKYAFQRKGNSKLLLLKFQVLRFLWCVCFIPELSSVFRKNKLQMLLRIQAQSWDFCFCPYAYTGKSEVVRDWLTPNMCVTLQGIGRDHVASLAGHYQCVTQWRDGHFLWDKTHHTHQLLPWVIEECLSKPINWVINLGPTGNPLQSICPLLHSSRSDTMAVALN